MRKNRNSLAAQPVSVLILEDLSVIAVFVDLSELKLEGNPHNIINTRMPRPHLFTEWPKINWE